MREIGIPEVRRNSAVKFGKLRAGGKRQAQYKGCSAYHVAGVRKEAAGSKRMHDGAVLRKRRLVLNACSVKSCLWHAPKALILILPARAFVMRR